MKTYHGYQFKRAVVIGIHKICSDLGLRPVEVRWDAGTQTACINKSGSVKLANVKDDAVLTQGDLMRYVGMAVHEILHWMYTDFDAVQSAYAHGQYIAQLHNALEDAWIESKGIKSGLTGNIEELLSALINGMVAEGLAHINYYDDKPIDWSDPAQYPFVLAVYARKHAKIKVPLAIGLEPIFAEAVKRLNTCGNSWDTLEVAKWVFDQLNNVNSEPEDEPVPPPTNPTNPSDDEGDDEDKDKGDNGSGDDSEQPTGGDQGGDIPTPKGDPAKPPTKDGETVKAREVEPTANPPEGAGSGGSYSTDDVMRKGYHTRADNPRTFPIDF
ncbi:MAG: hypothetical protein EBS36_06855 [Actinobacteria bacterium]|nr:hypothetical protein [Actinomycetota bacterium]